MATAAGINPAMLFNSTEFLFLFLPAALAGFYGLGRWRASAAMAWLVAASLFFYGWWEPRFLAVLLASVAFNYTAGRFLGREADAWRKAALVLGVAANLAVLGYFKYRNFFLENLGLSAAGAARLVLPLGISFITFQKIAYLVDCYKRKVSGYGLLDYSLFVSFFPQLIAGPIVHHAELIPQLQRRRVRLDAALAAAGLTLFVFGLAKKVLLADGVAPMVDGIFAMAERGAAIGLLPAWGAALGYTAQIYFDFSGYSDMAVGLALLFGIRLPRNFASPYKATSIVEFWRRWHMTLSRFLRDYLYIPLGGNRRGPARRYLNLLATMVLGGLWHGAAWTFVAWGTLHGLYLLAAHAWRDRVGIRLGRLAGWLLTFPAVVVAWVFFRADSLAGAGRLLRAMAGLDGVALPKRLAALAGPWEARLAALGIRFDGVEAPWFSTADVATVALLLLVALAAPSALDLCAAYRPTVDGSGTPGRLRWRPGRWWAAATAAAACAVLLNLTRVSPFIYFQF